MKDFLPSRGVIALVLIPAITIVSIWAVLRYYQAPNLNANSTDEETIETVIAKGQAEFLEKDSDSDGLKDWQEFLYKTDESNPDTDGDGFTDGDEVVSGSDPLLVGTATATSTVSDSGFLYYKNDPTLTKTELLARDLLVSYTELGRADALNNPAIRDSVITSLIQQAGTVESRIALTIDDLSIVPDSPAAKQRYKNDFIRVTRKLTAIQYYELELFGRYVELRDEEALVQLEKQANLYEIVATDLQNIQVPNAIAGVHLELANNFFIMADTVRVMLTVDNDPLGAYVHAKKFREDEALLQQNANAIKLYFERN